MIITKRVIFFPLFSLFWLQDHIIFFSSQKNKNYWAYKELYKHRQHILTIMTTNIKIRQNSKIELWICYSSEGIQPTFSLFHFIFLLLLLCYSCSINWKSLSLKKKLIIKRKQKKQNMHEKSNLQFIYRLNGIGFNCAHCLIISLSFAGKRVLERKITETREF